MADARNPDDYCYRHSDRLSFVLCEQCGRTICLECQTHVGGKVLCPDDAKRSNVTMLPVNRRPPRPRRVRQSSRLFAWVTDSTPVVTYTLLFLLVILLIADVSSQGNVSRFLSVNPTGLIGYPDVLHQPWSLVTSMLLPGSIFGLLINGYSTYVLGNQLERLFGRRKLIVLYLVSGFGASVFSFFLNARLSYSIGAIAGLVAATVIVVRRMGGNLIFMYVTCAVSLAFAFLFGQWEGAIGGALAGIGTTLTYLYDDGSQHHRQSRIILGGLVLLLAALAVLRIVVIGV